ncbi:MKI67 FHA domain-interacting nucleolar phosphoprotein [Protopterus annectens]|uniref:MKI67 FHA domain-interacting nucleolar phosphoprotein n=1 Tax=Protopterus annectens TaxID=7888 RepID=UPI001CF9E08A|nr:MKI67 FHA domain-interacting nucleolar phosphoprotein [Protopterus annectens]
MAAKDSKRETLSHISLYPDLQEEFQAKVTKIAKHAKQEVLTPGVVYLGHIPVGFQEPQIRGYFSQFGTITRLRLSRSKKTGHSKGYAFVEFECDEVAKIVAETMNNYLFNERILKCHFMPPEKVHPSLFKGCDRLFKKPCRPSVARYNRKRNVTQKAKMIKKLTAKENKLRKRLSEKGIDYDFPGFAAQKPKKKRKETTNPDSPIEKSESSEAADRLEKTKKQSTEPESHLDISVNSQEKGWCITILKKIVKEHSSVMREVKDRSLKKNQQIVDIVISCIEKKFS